MRILLKLLHWLVAKVLHDLCTHAETKFAMYPRHQLVLSSLCLCVRNNLQGESLPKCKLSQIEAKSLIQKAVLSELDVLLCFWQALLVNASLVIQISVAAICIIYITNTIQESSLVSILHPWYATGLQMNGNKHIPHCCVC